VTVAIELENRSSAPVDEAGLRGVLAAALAAEGVEDGDVGVAVVDEPEMAELNAAHRGKDGPTDVLSFPLLPPEAFPPHTGARSPASAAFDFALPPGRRPHLGDIIVSVERAAEQADQGRGGQTGDVRWDARDELRLLVTHGTLHVCGWDHAEPDEEAAMRALERELLAD
jgi:probable rRNA maturation factor